MASLPAPGPLRDPEGGQAVLEFVITFPLWLLMTLGIMQMGLMYGAQQVVHYAALCGARAELVKGDTDEDDVDPEKAVTIACLPVAGRTMIGGMTMPSMSGSYKDMSSTLDYVLESFIRQLMMGMKTKYTKSGDDKCVTSEVTLDFELQMPIVNRIFVYWYSLGAFGMTEGGISDLMNLNFDNLVLTFLYGDVPHIKIKEKTSLPRPWGEEDYKDEED
ncbi:MAG: pilus assembly protein [Planctomycetes bacterium]|nr:pilus assembly protein [Planctomycetota bacterium]